MEWFLLENPSFCIDKMLNSSAFTCGVDLLNEHSWHYSGNFWASSCQWIETLPKTLGSDYFSTEMWIGSGIQEMDFEKHITLFQSKNIIDCLYDTAILPEMYVQNWMKGNSTNIAADWNGAIEEELSDSGNTSNTSKWNDTEMVEHLFNSDTIDYINVNDLSPLFNHDVHPPSLREGILKKIRKVSLVISHCDYPLDWIERFTAGFESIIDKVWVLTKCNQNVTGAPPESQIIPLPNVGRCDHSYAYWLNHFFPEMDEKDASDQIVVFMKDADYMLSYWGDRNFGDMLSLAVSNGLGCMKMNWIASVLHRYNMLRQMRWYGVGHVRAEGRGGDENVVPFNNIEFEDIGEWVDKLQLGPIFDTKNLVSICHGGFFAATHIRIAKQPKRVWEALEKSLSRGDSIVEGHYAERIWGCLLSKPISNETAVAILDQNFNTEYGNFPFRGLIYSGAASLPEMYVQNWMEGNLTSTADLNAAIQEERHDLGNTSNTSKWNDTEMVEHLFNSDTIDYIDVNNLSPLFNHDVHPPSLREGILKKIRKVSLVISHCDYPLDWIERFTAGFESIIDKVWVFTKCNQNVTGAPPESQIIPLPNVGRCDHSYAYWLYHFFPEMDEKDASDQIVVFMKDADYMLPYWGDRNFGDMLSLAVSNGLGCMKINWIASVLHNYDMVRLMRWYGVGHVKAEGRGGDENVVPFKNAEFEDIGEWVDKLQLGPIFDTKNLVSICYGGFFAATHVRIAKQPKRVWEALEKSLSRGDSIVEGHYAERIWGCLLSKPISNETAVAIVDKNFNTEYGNFPIRGMIYQQEVQM